MDRTHIGLLVVIGMFLWAGCVSSQDSTESPAVVANCTYCRLVTMPQFFDGLGVVFPSNYRFQGDIPGFVDRFSPSDNEVVATEDILGRADDFFRSSFDDQYNRQYLGLIDTTGSRIVLVQLLDFSDKSEAEEHFSMLKFLSPTTYVGWKREWVFGSGPFYEKHTKRYLVDLATGHAEDL